MKRHVGHVSELVRYPVKSMAGSPVETVELGWEGFEGDRRFAFRRLDLNNGFPWLTARHYADLVRYHPIVPVGEDVAPLPTHVRTPEGTVHELRSAELVAELAHRSGFAVELMHLKLGIFDKAAVSVIARATTERILQESGVEGAPDCRRFRPNVVVETANAEPFAENEWVGGVLRFGDGDGDERPAVSVIKRDSRCGIININPDTSERDPRVLKAAVDLNEKHAGVYATVVRTGTIRVGDRVELTSP